MSEPCCVTLTSLAPHWGRARASSSQNTPPKKKNRRQLRSRGRAPSKTAKARASTSGSCAGSLSVWLKAAACAAIRPDDRTSCRSPASSPRTGRALTDETTVLLDVRVATEVTTQNDRRDGHHTETDEGHEIKLHIAPLLAVIRAQGDYVPKGQSPFTTMVQLFDLPRR